MNPSLTAPLFSQNPRDSDRSPIFANWRPFYYDVGDGNTAVMTQFDFLDGTDFDFLSSTPFDFLV